MKFLLVLCLFAVAAYGLPAKHSGLFDSSDESFFILPLNRHHSKKEVPSVVEVEVGDSDEDTSIFPSYFRPFFFNPFSFMNFGFSDFFSKPTWMDGLVPKDVPETSIKNSTSTTKVVDGHKITVNDTIYENEKNGAVYRLQVVEILPAESQEKESGEKGDKSSEEGGVEKDVKTEMSPAEVDADKVEASVTEKVKPDQNSHDNEIQKEEILASFEWQGDDPSVLNDIENIDFSGGHAEKRENVEDLSNDLRVNHILSENARRGGLYMIPPDVEVFDSIDQISSNYQEHQDQTQQVLDPFENQSVVKPTFN